MSDRDPHRTARIKTIESMKAELRAMLPTVLMETGFKDEASLNAKIGAKADIYIDLPNEVINSPEHYVVLWLEGFQQHIVETERKGGSVELFEQIKGSPAFKRYLNTFLRRSYLKHYDELYKKRPKIEEAEVWIGQNNADYGLLVSPRFVADAGIWVNDKSEIRHFKPTYWTIGHILKTGLVVPKVNAVQMFQSIEAFLMFFEHTMVRGTGSSHQQAIAARYCDFVRKSDSPENVPLLIPELRYEGRAAKHKYRLDFWIIDANTMDRVGFELSPWSTHGELTGIKGKTQQQVNAEASANFEHEMKKHKDFFKKHGIFSLIYTGSELQDPDKIFSDVATYLSPRNSSRQLSLHFINEYFR